MQFVVIFNLIKKFWWIIPLLGIIVYIFILNYKIDNLNKNIQRKNQTIINMQHEIDFQNEKIENQEQQINALKALDEKIKIIENKYKRERARNKEIIKKYKENLDTVPIMKQLKNLLPRKTNE